MTDDLIKRAREDDTDPVMLQQMADTLEAQATEIARLREALGWFLTDSRFVIQVGGNPNVVPQMIAAARAALEAKP